MRNPNERITDLEASVVRLDGEIEAIAHVIPWAIHKALEGLMDQRKISYIEKRLVWEAVSREIQEGLAMAPRLSLNLEGRLKEIERWSRSHR